MCNLSFEKFIENYLNTKCSPLCKLLMRDCNKDIKASDYRIVKNRRKLYENSTGTYK